MGERGGEGGGVYRVRGGRGEGEGGRYGTPPSFARWPMPEMG